MTAEDSGARYDRLYREAYGEGDLARFGPVHRHLRRLVARHLRALSYVSVLDVGCGPGLNYELLCGGRSGVSFAGSDVSEAALKVAAERVPEGVFQLSDLASEAPSGVYDLVHCSLVLEHIEDDRSALAHLRAATGRYLVLSTIGGDWARYRPWEEKVGHVRNYRRGELEEMVRAAGFVVERMDRWGFPFYSPIGRLAQNAKVAADIGLGRYGLRDRLVAEATYQLFRLNTRRLGDLLVLTARAA